MIISSSFSVRVIYADTDQMGFVYYGNYAKYFEIGRVELIRSIGLSYKQLESIKIMMPVLDLQVKYIRPALYDDLLTITTKILEVPTGARIKFDYEIHNQNQELICQGNTQLVFVNSLTKKPVKCPKILSSKLKSIAKEK